MESSSSRSSGAIIGDALKFAYYNSLEEGIEIAEWDGSEGHWIHRPVVGFDKTEYANYLCMEYIGGRPCVAYHSEAEDALMYVRAADQWGFNWFDPVVVDNYNNSGGAISMINLQGKPAIAYRADGGQLRYAYQVGP